VNSKNVLKTPQECFNSLKGKYPIPNYVDDAELECIFIANLIRRFLPEGGRVLDLGCGGMDKAALLALLGYEMHAADDFQDPWHLRHNNLEKLKKFARDFEITLTVQNKQNYKLNYPEDYFDACMVGNVIEHLHESPRDLLNNAGFLLREGGVLLITMPNSVNLRKRLSILLGKSNYPSVKMFYECIGTWRGHIREYTLAEQEYILRRNGFTILFSSAYHGMIDTKLKSNLVKQLYKAICWLFPTMRECLATVAQKPPGWKPVTVDPELFRKSMIGFVPKGIE